MLVLSCPPSVWDHVAEPLRSELLALSDLSGVTDLLKAEVTALRNQFQELLRAHAVSPASTPIPGNSPAASPRLFSLSSPALDVRGSSLGSTLSLPGQLASLPPPHALSGITGSSGLTALTASILSSRSSTSSDPDGLMTVSGGGVSTASSCCAGNVNDRVEHQHQPAAAVLSAQSQASAEADAKAVRSPGCRACKGAKV